jgi:hypothetical protein
MPTQFLCDNCQLPGTSFQESGKGVAIAPEADEHVRFFHLDTAVFRTQYGLREQGVCDLLVEYCRGTGDPVDLFTELKGAGGCGHAARQVECAFEVLHRDLLACQRGVGFRALIVTSASSPPNREDLVRRLTKKGMSRVHFKTGVKRGAVVPIRQFVT